MENKIEHNKTEIPAVTNLNPHSALVNLAYRSAVATEGSSPVGAVNSNLMQKVKTSLSIGTMGAIINEGWKAFKTGDNDTVWENAKLAGIMFLTATQTLASATATTIQNIPIVGSIHKNAAKIITAVDDLGKIPVAGTAVSLLANKIASDNAIENGDSNTATAITLTNASGIGAELAVVLARNAIVAAQIYSARKTLNGAKLLTLSGEAVGGTALGTGAVVLVAGEVVTECVAAKINSTIGTNVKGGTLPSLLQYTDSELQKYTGNPSNKDDYLLEAAKATKDIVHSVGYSIKDVCSIDKQHATSKPIKNNTHKL